MTRARTGHLFGWRTREELLPVHDACGPVTDIRQIADPKRDVVTRGGIVHEWTVVELIAPAFIEPPPKPTDAAPVPQALVRIERRHARRLFDAA